MASNDNITGSISFTRELPPNAAEGTLAGTLNLTGEAASVLRQAAAGPAQVTLTRSASPPTQDQSLWTAIRNRTDALGFNRYNAFIHRLLCEGTDTGTATCGAPSTTPDQGTINGNIGSIGTPSIDDRIEDLINRPSIYGVDAYQLLKLATQAFLLFEGGVAIEPPRIGGNANNLELEEESRLGRPITLKQARDQLEQYLATQIGTIGGRGLPYLKRVVDALIPAGNRKEDSPFCENTLRNRLRCPALIELIFNYWLEQGALVQTMNAVLLRFQNRRRAERDPLVNLALDPLRPLANLLWGRLQDEPQHLSVSRRAHEYRYAYGLSLFGRAVADIAPVESREQFIESFHTLLHKAAEFYAADAITTVVADGFPLLQALKDLHLVLAESANNQFDELKRQARIEALADQFLLARPEMREFLRGRAMVPYAEAWMGQVDTMKRMQGWMPNLSVSHFHILATTGEQLLLSVRFGDWTAVIDQAAAVNWARYWKPEVQNYLHSYAAVTGVDLAADVNDVRRAEDRNAQPSVHLRNRMLAQQGRAALSYEAAQEEFVVDQAPDVAYVPRLPRRTRGA